jgi:hypothetical protein
LNKTTDLNSEQKIEHTGATQPHNQALQMQNVVLLCVTDLFYLLQIISEAIVMMR